MKHQLYILFLLLTIATQLPAQTMVRARYTTEDSVWVTQQLQRAVLADTLPSLNLFFARQLLGRPYVAHTLEGNDDEPLTVNTRQLDCTTLVETVLALTMTARSGSTQFSDYLAHLSEMRYRDGISAGYTSRLHYFTDWIIDNSRRGMVIELQQPSSLFAARQTIKVGYMTTYPHRYEALRRHPEWVPLIRQTEQAINGKTFAYIPKKLTNRHSLMRQYIHDGDVIAITCKKEGLDIAHLGFAVWRNDGLHLLNASSIHHKVVEEPMTLYQYLYKHPSHTGVRILRLKTNNIKK